MAITRSFCAADTRVACVAGNGGGTTGVGTSSAANLAAAGGDGALGAVGTKNWDANRMVRVWRRCMESMCVCSDDGESHGHP